MCIRDRSCASTEEFAHLLGKGRAKRGMLEGDLIEGELEIGQVSGMIDDILPVQEIVNNIIAEYNLVLSKLSSFS